LGVPLQSTTIRGLGVGEKREDRPQERIWIISNGCPFDKVLRALLYKLPVFIRAQTTSGLCGFIGATEKGQNTTLCKMETYSSTEQKL
jgi:hypothetical protein